MGIWTKEGLLALTGVVLAETAGHTTRIHLFKNDFTPGLDTEAGDLVECDFAGYGAVVLSNGLWSPPSINGDDRAQIDLPVMVWVKEDGTANDVYGWYWSEGGTPFCCERFADAPRPMIVTGVDEIVLHVAVLFGNVPPPP
jgi:hypothetical protein